MPSFKEYLEDFGKQKTDALESHRELVRVTQLITTAIGHAVNSLYRDLPPARILHELYNDEAHLTVTIGHTDKDDEYRYYQARPLQGFRTMTGGLVETNDFIAVLVEAVERIEASFERDVQRANQARLVADFLKGRVVLK